MLIVSCPGKLARGPVLLFSLSVQSMWPRTIPQYQAYFGLFLKIDCFHTAKTLGETRPPPNPSGIIPSKPQQNTCTKRGLKELPASRRVAVADVLGGEAASFFVCNSDALYFNEPPPALAAGELLQPEQIYFLLPAAALGRPLSSADMAALAVRASSALAAKRSHRRGGKNKKVRVVPVPEELEHGEDVLFNEKLNEQTLGEFAVAVSPAKKSHQKLAARSRLKLKRALSVIQEIA